MEQGFWLRKSFSYLVYCIGALLIIFLIAALILKIHDTSIALKHAVYPNKTVSISADGKVKAIPDTAYLYFTLTSSSTDVTKLPSTTLEQLNGAYDYFTGHGIDANDILVTQGINTNDPANTATLENINNLSVEIKDKNPISLANKIDSILLNAASKGLAANQSVPNCLSFESLDAPIKPAREQALQNAQVKAQDIAKVSNFNLGKLVNFSENTTYAYNSMYGGNSCLQSPIIGMKITPQELTDSVTATYEIK